MSDLISREALIEKLKKSIKWCEDNLESSTASFQSGCIAAIKDVISTVKMEETCPSVEAKPIRHGRWVEQEKYTFGTMYDCSICDNRILDNGHSWNYCPNCGAKMDEVSE